MEGKNCSLSSGGWEVRGLEGGGEVGGAVQGGARGGVLRLEGRYGGGSVGLTQHESGHGCTAAAGGAGVASGLQL